MHAPRLRFAPSPSGFLHIGGARTALFCWLLARRFGGQFVLRVEDTDAARSTNASIAAIVDGLRWLGLDWDEGPEVDGPHAPYFQSQRRDIYQRYIDQLIESGHLYRCDCSPELLQEKREAALAAGRKPIYDGTCRHRSDVDPGKPHVLRLRSPDEGETVVDDAIRGQVVFRNEELGDQVVVRSNGDPLYNFVVVVDDATMGITHVVRGDDHLANTPKQVQLYEALGFDVPKFAHVPLILGADKKRLSKRHGATNVMQYDTEGYLPEAMVNFLVRLGWSHGDQEEFTVDELREVFSLESVGKSAGVWNPEKLLWLNARWITRLDSADLARRVAPRIEARGWPTQALDALMLQRIDTLKERARTLEELVDQGAYYWLPADGLEPDAAARKKFLKAGLADKLRATHAALTELPEWTEEALDACVHGLCEAWEFKLGKIAQPLRVAITGSKVSPGIFETLAALGREKSLWRLDEATAYAEARAEALK